MARPRNFDEDEALARASELFARDGYEATSVDKLVSATGVPRASLYSIFGSKHGILVRALRALEPPYGPEQLDLILVALVERAPHDRAIREELTSLDQETRRAIAERLFDRAGIPKEQP